MIRTLVEIQGDRVSIRETGAETTVTVTVDSAPSEAGALKINDVQTAVLQREVAELIGRARKAEAEVERQRDRADQNKGWAERAEAELERRTKERDEREAARANLEKSMGEEIRKLRAQVAEYDRDRTTERDRADRNMTRAQKAEGSLAESRELVAFKDKIRADVDQDNVKLRGKVRELAAQIRKVNGAVHSPEMLSALVLAPGLNLESVDTLANAVRNVRQIIGSPSGLTGAEWSGA